MGIKAIQTIYSGYKFRSRLEARYAVFFDALGVKWDYEIEGFELGNGERYLPDFWLPEQKIWVEIKGEPPETDYYDKIERFKNLSGQAVVIFSSLFKYWGVMFAWETCDGGGGSWENNVLPCFFSDGFGFICCDDCRVDHDRTVFADPGFNHQIRMRKYEKNDKANSLLKTAYLKAKQARFEHGERG